MPDYNYDDIAHRWFEELKLPFINYLRANFIISYDEIMDLYTEAWIEVRRIILEGRATGSNWKALIFTIGRRQAEKIATRRLPHGSISSGGDEEEEGFNYWLFEAEKAAQKAAKKTLCEDPELQKVLGEELGYIPEPCNKILKLYYYGDFSMKEIAEMMNYSNAHCAVVTKKRCFQKLKNRVEKTAYRMGILEKYEIRS